MLNELYSHTCARCGGKMPTAEGEEYKIDLNKILERAVKKVYKGDADKVQKHLTEGFATILGDAVKENYAGDIHQVNWDSPDAQMIRHLQANVYEFSGAKSWHQLRALTDAMYHDGRLVPWKEFKEIAGRINGEFVTRHLKTEYSTAEGSARMASKWMTFQNEKKALPNLIYETAGDSRVRKTHAKLDGICRPVDDDFWKTYYPPNGWNCRCDVIQATGGRRITPAESIEHPDDVPPMFKINTADSGLIFPEDHPYYTELPPQILNITRQQNPYRYIKEHTGKEGKGWVYNSVVSKAERHEVAMARTLADNGEEVVLLPELHAQTEMQKALRELVLPESVAGESYNVDALVKGKLLELKRITTSNINTLTARMEEGFKKSKIVCLKTSHDFSKTAIMEQLNGLSNKGQAWEELWWIDANDNLTKIKATKQ